MSKMLLMIALACLVGCATNPLDQKRKAILDCVKDLKMNDTETMDAFEICSKVYRLNVESRAKLAEPSKNN